MALKLNTFVPIRIYRDTRNAGPISDPCHETLSFFSEFSEFSSEPAEAGERARDVQHIVTSTTLQILHDFCILSGSLGMYCH